MLNIYILIKYFNKMEQGIFNYTQDNLGITNNYIYDKAI